ncbi:MAG: carbamoyltransferase HypF [Gemmatimonadota bacterium]
MRTRRLVAVEGMVQGVGFRPFVHHLATELGLHGLVRNDSSGVHIDIEGDSQAVEAFLLRLAAEPPSLALIDQVRVETAAPAHARGFVIAASESTQQPTAQVSPDVAICAACQVELLDPTDRRYRHPFISCTNCGPRFSIVQGVPYDRHLTTMAGFAMCAPCRIEYEDPADRRFHAQPIACHDCGPVVRLIDATGNAPENRSGRDLIQRAAEYLLAGEILAIKGLGGFHLACRADDELAVARLRTRKHREEKPFAVMVRDLSAARILAHLKSAEESLLLSRQAPIVLVRRRRHSSLAPSVAPAARHLGLMLPYTPLHLLLLSDAGVPLVMTSGNLSDEPIAYRDEDALRRLATVADRFLLHDRAIETRTDDSVTRVVQAGAQTRPLVLRRSRGYVPIPLRLPVSSKPLLACGGELKNTFCVVSGNRAWVGPHIGDLENYETLCSYQAGIRHFEKLFDVTPESLAHDLHPDYLSTRYALDRRGIPSYGVQHHHAHLAACLAEHGQTEPAIGIIFDGSGYGPDGTVWGGEILLGDLHSYRRIGHLWPARLPGGVAAIREPWRMASAWLHEALGADSPAPREMVQHAGEGRWHAVARLIETAVASPITTSMGRLFDAVSALLGIRYQVNYEGQAAIELERAANLREKRSYSIPILVSHGVMILDARVTIRAILEDLKSGGEAGRMSARFHNGLVSAALEICQREKSASGNTRVVLSGGVFQNSLLLERTYDRLTRGGFTVFFPEKLPPNDGGISFGQAAVVGSSTGPNSPPSTGSPGI